MLKATQNQLNNLDNPAQTKVKKVLCLCSVGMLRSPTLANLLHAEFGWNTRSAGVDKDFALVPVSEALLKWADLVVCVELSVLFELVKDDEQAEAVENTRVVPLNVPDEFNWNEKELRDIMLEQVKDKLKEFLPN